MVPRWVSRSISIPRRAILRSNTTASRNDDIIASSHHGPGRQECSYIYTVRGLTVFLVAVYIAPTSSNGAGAVWTKIFEDTYSGSWAVDRLISSHGQHSVTIPNIPAGAYLLRGSIPSCSSFKSKSPEELTHFQLPSDAQLKSLLSTKPMSSIHRTLFVAPSST